MSKHLLWGLFGLKLLSRIIMKLKRWRCSPFSTDNTSLPNLSLFPLLLLAYFSRQTKRFELGKDRSCLSGVFLREREFLWCRSFAELKCSIIGYSGLKKKRVVRRKTLGIFSLIPYLLSIFLAVALLIRWNISLSLQLSSAKKFKIVSIHISRELERTMVRERNSVQKIMKRFTFFLLLFLLHCWQIKRSKFVAVLLKEETRLGKWSEHLFLPKNWLRWIHHVPIKRVVTRRGKERLHCIDTGRKHDFRKRQQGR